ncbi:hypothetical protein niasHT_021770 [Heterodera trifolii]|uniref:Uncharacterized protein n=1 Tax=Heterodera trifolii TaxID=157864 RepID=A0ABD2JEA1_9BILA
MNVNVLNLLALALVVFLFRQKSNSVLAFDLEEHCPASAPSAIPPPIASPPSEISQFFAPFENRRIVTRFQARKFISLLLLHISPTFSFYNLIPPDSALIQLAKDSGAIIVGPFLREMHSIKGQIGEALIAFLTKMSGRSTKLFAENEGTKEERNSARNLIKVGIIFSMAKIIGEKLHDYEINWAKEILETQQKRGKKRGENYQNKEEGGKEKEEEEKEREKKNREKEEEEKEREKEKEEEEEEEEEEKEREKEDREKEKEKKKEEEEKVKKGEEREKEKNKVDEDGKGENEKKETKKEEEKKKEEKKKVEKDDELREHEKSNTSAKDHQSQTKHAKRGQHSQNEHDEQREQQQQQQQVGHGHGQAAESVETRHGQFEMSAEERECLSFFGESDDDHYHYQLRNSPSTSHSQPNFTDIDEYLHLKLHSDQRSLANALFNWEKMCEKATDEVISSPKILQIIREFRTEYLLQFVSANFAIK